MSRGLRLLDEHHELTRRYFLQLGTAAAAAIGCAPLAAQEAQTDPLLAEAIARLEYLTPEAHSPGVDAAILRRMN